MNAMPTSGAMRAVALEPITAADMARVDGLQLFGDQPTFVGGWREVLAEIDGTGDVGAWAIAMGPDTAGLLFLRRGAALRPWAPADAVTLHSFVIDAQFQGRGMATAALAVLPETARAFAPGATRLMLAVNVANTYARDVYVHLGFRDTGHLFDGPKGPQFILESTL